MFYSDPVCKWLFKSLLPNCYNSNNKLYLQLVLNLIVNLNAIMTPVLPIFETRCMSDFDQH